MSLPEMLFLYGPPGSGKTTIGRLLAKHLELPFYDLDAEIEAISGLTIPAIFDKEGEAGFRQREAAVLQQVLSNLKGVLALGGGTLTVPAMRQQVEAAGEVLLLTAGLDILAERLEEGMKSRPASERPLLKGDLRLRLEELIQRRTGHYASFRNRLDTGNMTAAESAWQCQVRLGRYRVKGMGQSYAVLAIPGSIHSLGEIMQARGLGGPLALVTDEHVSAIYAQPVMESLKRAGYPVKLLTIPPGEAHKNIATLQQLWDGFIEARMDRSSTVVALGGGVVGDLAGFAAATFLRGVRWVNVPTSLLAMVDSSLGGKTGADLAQGKNLIGAFHPPALVLADPQVLTSLPEAELRSGMAEVVKHGVIGDTELFTQAGQYPPPDWQETVRRGMAVKVRVIEADPYERGLRATLNLGHTVGHAVEQASGFRLRHGECVAIGMAAEAHLAEQMGIAEAGLAETIAQTLEQIGLPTRIPKDLNRQAIRQAMGVDKKRYAGKLRFALPRSIGEVIPGIEVTNLDWLEAI
jgi:shikimate kinase / 3-dehydroquinate synthase